jgi:hypothetical protein
MSWCVATSVARSWSARLAFVDVRFLMLLWFAALAVGGVLLVFRDPRLDHRLVALGAVLPLPIDALISAIGGQAGRTGPLHAISTHIVLLGLSMAATVGRKPIRKRALALVIGGFGHLVLDGAWADSKSFGWPIGGFGWSGRLQFLERGLIVNVAMELVGAGVGLLLYRRCRLDRPQQRSAFVSRGSLELLPVRRKRPTPRSQQ